MNCIFSVFLYKSFLRRLQTCFSCQNSAKSTPHPAPAVSEKPVAKKCKSKTKANIPTSGSLLDQTCIHPESYHVAQRYSTQTNTHSHTRTLGQQPIPLAKACLGWDGVDLDTGSYGAGYSGGGLWFDLHRHRIQREEVSALYLCLSVWVYVLVWEMMVSSAVISKAHWTCAQALCVLLCVWERDTDILNEGGPSVLQL